MIAYAGVVLILVAFVIAQWDDGNDPDRNAA